MLVVLADMAPVLGVHDRQTALSLLHIITACRLRDFNRFYPEDQRRRPQEEVEVAVLQDGRSKPMALLVPVDDGEAGVA